MPLTFSAHCLSPELDSPLMQQNAFDHAILLGELAQVDEFLIGIAIILLGDSYAASRRVPGKVEIGLVILLVRTFRFCSRPRRR